MRSRYSAYVVENVDYLMETHDPSTREGLDREAAERWARESKWLGLEILATERGGEGDTDGIVEFKASYQAGPGVKVHHERSRFVRHDDRWFFLDGDNVKAKPATRGAKVGRNDPCPCGSGKKHKRCCGA